MLVGNWLVIALLVDKGKAGNVGVLMRDGSQDAISALTVSVASDFLCLASDVEEEGWRADLAAVRRVRASVGS